MSRESYDKELQATSKSWATSKWAAIKKTGTLVLPPPPSNNDVNLKKNPEL